MYRDFATTLDELAGSFVDTRYETNSTFNGWFSTPSIANGETNYPASFPFFTPATLRLAAGFTNWTIHPLDSWGAWPDKSIVDQVERAIGQLKYTVNSTATKGMCIRDMTGASHYFEKTEDLYDSTNYYYQSVATGLVFQINDDPFVYSNSGEQAHEPTGNESPTLLFACATNDFDGSPAGPVVSVELSKRFWSESGTAVWEDEQTSDFEYKTSEYRGLATSLQSLKLFPTNTAPRPVIRDAYLQWRWTTFTNEAQYEYQYESTNNLMVSFDNLNKQPKCTNTVAQGKGSPPTADGKPFFVLSGSASLAVSQGVEMVLSAGLFPSASALLNAAAGDLYSYDYSDVVTNFAMVGDWEPWRCVANFGFTNKPATAKSDGFSAELTLLELNRWLDDATNAPPQNPYLGPNGAAVGKSGLLPDTDRDDLIDTGADLSAMGTDTGSMLWRPDQAEPCTFLPLSVESVRSPALEPRGYLAGVAQLPYQYQTQDSDVDGYDTAFSFNTKLLQVVSTNLAGEHLKLVSVLRPRGQLVVFEFPWEGANFSAYGYPTGIHSNRTYVLKCTTNEYGGEVHDLYFDSGVAHRFYGSSVQLFDYRGQSNWITLGDMWMVYDRDPTNAISVDRYDATVWWDQGRLDRIEYRSRQKTGATVACQVNHSATGGVVSLVKSGPGGVDNSSVSWSGSTLMYGSGETVSRATSGGGTGDVRTVTLQYANPQLDAYSIETAFDAADRVVAETLVWNNQRAATSNRYQAATGRYANGFPRAAKIVRRDYPDGSWNSFEYDADRGWLTASTRPTAFGEERTDYAYDVTQAGYDGPCAEMAVERPRKIARSIGSTVVGLTYAGYVGHTIEEIRRKTGPTASWTDPGLTWRILRDEYFGWVYREESPTDTNAVVRLESTNGLDIVRTGEHGDAVTNRYSLFGHPAGFGLGARGLPVRSEVATQFDAFGRPEQLVAQDGSTNVQSHGCWGLESMARPDGSRTGVAYYPGGLPRSVTNDGIVTVYERDALGRITRETVTGGGDSNAVTRSWDILGRCTAMSDPATAYSLSTVRDGNVDVTTIDCTSSTNVGDQVVKTHLDGRVLEIGGEGAVERKAYSYSIKEARRCVREAAEGAGESGEWTEVYFDLLDRPCAVLKSGNATPLTIAYDERGVATDVLDEAGRRIVAQVDMEKGETLQGLDRNGNGSADPSGNDRLTRNTALENGSKIETFPADNSGTARELLSVNFGDGKSIAGQTPRGTFGVGRSDYGSNGNYTLTNRTAEGEFTVTSISNGIAYKVESYGKDGLKEDTAIISRTGLGVVEGISGSDQDDFHVEFHSGTRLPHVVTAKGVSTTYEYHPGTPWVSSVQRGTEPAVTYEYHPNGLLKRESGNNYTFDYYYDNQGRLTNLITATASHEWIFNNQGFLSQKKLGGQSFESYGYLPNGEFDSATNALNGVLKAVRENGDLTGLETVSGDFKWQTSVNRLGERTADGLTRNGAPGIQRAFTLSPSNTLDAVAVTGNGIVADHTSSFSYLMGAEKIGSTTLTLGGSNQTIGLAYNGELVATEFTNGDFCVSYEGTATNATGSATNLPYVGKITVKQGGSVKLVGRFDWNGNTHTLTNLTWTRNGGSTLASFGYTYATNLPRIARMDLPDGTYWEYLYEPGGALAGAVQRLPGGEAVAGRTYAYTYDQAGNMTSGGPIVGGQPLHSFQTGNNYLPVSRSWSNLVGVAGTATNAATVSVTMGNTGSVTRAVRQGDRYHAWARANNETGAVWEATKVTAVLFDTATFTDIIQEAEGRLYVPQNVETVSCSANGYIVADSRWTYTFDPFNRLEEMVSRNLPTNLTLKFDYYPDGKRARKIVLEGAATNRTHRYYYDRWNLVREEIACGGLSIAKQYLWGHDLAGWRSGQYDQEAGGIGGLVAISVATNGGAAVAYFPLADGQGNIRYLVDGSGNVVATYDYDPFGTLIAESGSAKGVCPFRFSSKYYDNETGLLYFGYRFFDSRTAKWLSVDPLGEAGGVNQTAYCRNDPVNNVDPLGLSNQPGDFGWGWYSVFIPELAPKPTAPPAAQPKCWISAAPERQFREVAVLRAPGNYNAKCLQQADLLVPSHFIGTRMGEQMAQFQADAIVSTLAQPGITYALQGLGHACRVGWLVCAEGQSVGSARAIVALSDDLTTAPIVYQGFEELAKRRLSTSWQLVDEVNAGWPPYSGFYGKSNPELLMPGSLADRFGDPRGTYLSPFGTPFEARALPASYLTDKRYYLYRVRQPLLVEGGDIAPHFNQQGLGRQWVTPKTIKELEDLKILECIFKYDPTVTHPSVVVPPIVKPVPVSLVPTP